MLLPHINIFKTIIMVSKGCCGTPSRIPRMVGTGMAISKSTRAASVRTRCRRVTGRRLAFSLDFRAHRPTRTVSYRRRRSTTSSIPTVCISPTALRTPSKSAARNTSAGRTRTLSLTSSTRIRRRTRRHPHRLRRLDAGQRRHRRHRRRTARRRAPQPRPLARRHRAGKARRPHLCP